MGEWWAVIPLGTLAIGFGVMGFIVWSVRRDEKKLDSPTLADRRRVGQNKSERGKDEAAERLRWRPRRDSNTRPTV